MVRSILLFFLFSFSVCLVSCSVFKGGKKIDIRISGEFGDVIDIYKKKGPVGKPEKKTESKKPDASKDPKGYSKVNVDNIIRTAKSYLGTPYQYGGSSRSGMDCSGLIYISFKAENIDLPRSSAQQSEYGKPIDIQNLKPGDLIFFSENKGKGKVTHAGMVTEVKNSDNIKFIHSSTKLGVVEDNFNSKYWRPLFLKAMRPYND